MKFNRTPRLQIRSDFRQLRQRPSASSHFKCLSLQVRQPVRVRFAFVSAISEDFLRFALGRGESFWLFGVVAFESSFGDSDLDCPRAVRFILVEDTSMYYWCVFIIPVVFQSPARTAAVGCPDKIMFPGTPSLLALSTRLAMFES